VTSSRSKQLSGILDRLPPAPEYWVAYSGGIDSHVLLHLLVGRRRELKGALAAVHVNHQIQSQSGDWELHCRAICDELDVPFHALRVEGRARTGESPEAVARTARYRGLAEWLPADAVLITAQHQDDQAETLLLQLFRGAGPKGLAAMPETARLGKGWLVRPFLTISRQDIETYARGNRLCWVEDPSNTDVRYDRNLLRQRIMPDLKQRWPGLAAVLSRVAAHQADQLELADALASLDFEQCRVSGSSFLLVSQLAGLSAARQRNLLRYWIADNGFALPRQAVLQRISQEVLLSRADARPVVHWPGAEIRRHRDRMYLMKPLPPHDPSCRLDWDLRTDVTLEDAGGLLTSAPVTGRGIRIPDRQAEIKIRFRQGGETLRIAGSDYHQSLKKCLQGWNIPYWERDRLPLVYINNELAAVAGFCACEGFQASAGEPGRMLHWSRTADW